MKQTRTSFDPIAKVYVIIERLTFGSLLEKTRLHYLPALTHSKNALVLGDGDGRFLARLLAENSDLCATAVDSSASMLRLLRRRCEASVPDVQQRLCTVHSDVLAFHTMEKYDLVVTHFFLDCFSDADLKLVMQAINPSVDIEALWVFSDFRVPQGALAFPARFLIRGLYFAFRVLTGLHVTQLPDHERLLALSGFSRIAFHHRFGGILTSELWKKGRGVHTSIPTHP